MHSSALCRRKEMQGIKAKSKSASPLIRMEEELNLAKRDSRERVANFALRFITALLTHLCSPADAGPPCFFNTV